MILREIIQILDEIAPPERALPDDRIGLLIGDPKQEVRSVIVTVDVTPVLLKERAADLIVAHHPLIYTPLRTVRLDKYPENLVYALINSGTSLFVMHTNYDLADGGINDVLADRLGIVNPRIVKAIGGENLFKLVVFVPTEAIEDVINSMCDAGAGWIGNYSHCTFRAAGIGTFKPLEGTCPYIGRVGEVEEVQEYKVETIVPGTRLQSVISAMVSAHPYEEVAYDVYPLKNKYKEWGLARCGSLSSPTTFERFCERVRDVLEVDSLRTCGDPDATVETVGVVGGSGGGELPAVLESGADVFVTGDIKHSQFLEAQAMGLMMIDAGHFETERPGMIALAPRLRDLLSPHGVTVEYFDDRIADYRSRDRT